MTKTVCAAALATLLLAPITALAAPILQPANVASAQGSFGGAFDISNAANQSGLSVGYVSGVTDFNAYVAVATHNAAGSLNSGFTGGGAPPGQFSFNMGSVVALDALAFWDTQNSGSVHQFNLYADNDQNFGNGVGALLGTFNAVGGGFGGAQPSNAQVFFFAPTLTQFLHIEVLTMEGGVGLFPGIGEVALRAVPEPATLLMLGAGVAGVFTRARRRNKQHNQ